MRKRGRKKREEGKKKKGPTHRHGGVEWRGSQEERDSGWTVDGQWVDSGWTVGMGSFRTVDGRGRARMGEDRLVQGWRLQVVNSARPGLIWGNGTPRRRLAQVVSVVTL